MKKIIFGLLFSLLAFQVNAATQTIEPGNLTAAFLAGPVNAGESFVEADILVLAPLAPGLGYQLNLAGTDLAVGSVTGFDIQIGGFSFTDTPIILEAGSYAISYLGVASLDNSLISFTVNATINEVPVPAAVWLFGSALMGLVGASRRKSASVAA